MSAWGDRFVDRFGGGVGDMWNNITGVTAQNAANAKQAALQMEFSAGEAQKNRDFQAAQSGTAHQREVADLRAAGLNPLLSGTGGMGSSTPSGAMGQSAGFPAQNNPNLFSTALEARRNHEEVKNLRETNANIRADTDLKTSARSLNSVLYNRTLEETDLTRSQRRTQDHETDIRGDTAKGAKVEGEIDSSRYGAALRYLDRAAGSVGSALGISKMFQQGRHNRWIRDGE